MNLLPCRAWYPSGPGRALASIFLFCSTLVGVIKSIYSYFCPFPLQVCCFLILADFLSAIEIVELLFEVVNVSLEIA